MVWSSSATTDTNPWYQLSVYTLNDPDQNVDFQVLANEQYPLYIYNDARAQRILESGHTIP